MFFLKRSRCLNLFLWVLVSLNVFCQPNRGNTPYGVVEISSGKIYALVIGISDYKNITDLQFADQDALAFRTYLLQANNPLVDSQQIELFLNSNATRVNISDAISGIIKKLKPKDRFYFYFAGHGDIEDLTQSKNGLLLLYDSPNDNYFGMSDGVIQVSQLADYFGKLTDQGVEVFYIIDACHSGKLKGGERGKNHTSKAIRNTLSDNATLLLSCDAGQLSIEGTEWGGGRGLFSYNLEMGLRGMADMDNDQNITLFELNQYVSKYTYLESDKRQTPVVLGPFNKSVTRVSGISKDSLRESISKVLRIPGDINFKGGEELLLPGLDSLSLEYYHQINNSMNRKSENSDTLILVFRKFLERNPESDLGSILRRKLILHFNKGFDEIINPIIRNGQIPRLKLDHLHILLTELDSCLSLIGKNHYLYDPILSRYYLIKAFITGFNIHINNYGPLNHDAHMQSMHFLHLSRSLEPNAAYTSLFLGIKHQTMQHMDSSFYYFNRATKLIPHSELIHNLIGVSLYNIGKKRESAQSLEKAIQLNERYYAAYANLISIYSDLCEFEKAEKIGKKVISINPDYTSAYNNLAEMYMKSGRIQDAYDLATLAEKRDTFARGPKLIRGIIHFRKKNFSIADTCFRSVLALQKDYEKAHWYLAQNFKSQQKWDSAIMVLKAYLKFDSSRVSYLKELGDCYSFNHKMDSAAYYYQRALHHAKLRNNDYVMIGDIYQYGFKDSLNAYNAYSRAPIGEDYGVERIVSNLVYMGRLKEYEKYRSVLAANKFDQTKSLYVKACFSAGAGEKEKVITYLKKVMAKNHQFKWQILNDPNFERFLLDPEFIKILE